MVNISKDQLELLVALLKVYYDFRSTEPEVVIDQLCSGALLVNFKAVDDKGLHPDLGLTFPPKS